MFWKEIKHHYVNICRRFLSPSFSRSCCLFRIVTTYRVIIAAAFIEVTCCCVNSVPKRILYFLVNERCTLRNSSIFVEWYLIINTFQSCCWTSVTVRGMNPNSIVGVFKRWRSVGDELPLLFSYVYVTVFIRADLKRCCCAFNFSMASLRS